MKTRSDIQGLRALAVALVVLSHANLFHLAGGYIGVDVFFVISGYLITSIILREYASNAALSNGLGWFSLRAFYLRRFKRIVPAAMLVLLVTTVASFLIFNSVRAHGIAIDALWSLFFLANLHFINLATDYFQQGFSTSPLQHFWSLAVEEQFYLIFPTLLLGALSIHGMKIRNYALNWRRRVGILIGVISLASFGWAVYATRSNPASSYFSSFSRAWELGLGALLAIFAKSSKAYLPLRLRQLVSGIGLLAILVTAFLFTSATPFPGLYTLIPTLGTALIIGSGINAEEASETFIQKISNFAPIAYLGTISYSVYLWHLPILIIASQRYANESTKLWFKLVLIAAILLVSAFTYNFYEGPLRHRIQVPAVWYQNKFRFVGIGTDVNRSRLIRILGSALGVLVVIAAVALVFIPKSSSQGSPHAISTTGTSGTSAPSPSPSLSIANYLNFPGVSAPVQSALSYSTELSTWMAPVNASTKLTKLPIGMFPSISGLQQNWKPAASFIQQIPVNVKKVAYIFGDSTAQRIPYLLTNNLDSNSWKIVMRAFPGCDLGSVNATGYQGINCRKLQNEFFAEVKSHPADLILITEQNNWFQNTPEQTSLANAKVTGLLNNLKYLAAHSKRLIFLGSLPTAIPLVDCVSGQTQLSPSCFANQDNFNFITAMESQLAKSVGGIYVNNSNWFCSNSVCPPIIGTTPVMIDKQHMTDAMSQKLSVLFGYWLWSQSWAKELI